MHSLNPIQIDSRFSKHIARVSTHFACTKQFQRRRKHAYTFDCSSSTLHVWIVIVTLGRGPSRVAFLTPCSRCNIGDICHGFTPLVSRWLRRLLKEKISSLSFFRDTNWFLRYILHTHDRHREDPWLNLKIESNSSKSLF